MHNKLVVHINNNNCIQKNLKCIPKIMQPYTVVLLISTCSHAFIFYRDQMQLMSADFNIHRSLCTWTCSSEKIKHLGNYRYVL